MRRAMNSPEHSDNLIQITLCEREKGRANVFCSLLPLRIQDTDKSMSPQVAQGRHNPNLDNAYAWLFPALFSLKSLMMEGEAPPCEH